MDTDIETGLGVFIPEADGVLQTLWDRIPFLEGPAHSAHITVMYPFLPPEAVNEQVLATLGEYFAKIPSFTFQLSGVERFPQVLYLVPEPEDPFIRMTEGLTEIYPQTYPYGGVHTEVIPHLTLAKVEADEHLDQITAAFEDISSESMPITARVEKVWLIELKSRKIVRYLQTFSLAN